MGEFPPGFGVELEEQPAVANPKARSEADVITNMTFSSLFIMGLKSNSTSKLGLKPNQLIGQDEYANSYKQYSANNIDCRGITTDAFWQGSSRIEGGSYY